MGDTMYNDNTDIKRIVDLIRQFTREYYSDANGVPYLLIEQTSGIESYNIYSPQFEALIRRAGREYHDLIMTPISIRLIQQELADQVMLNGNKRNVGLRISGNANCMYVDLRNPSNDVVRIGADGVFAGKYENAYFYRPPEQLALPRPDLDGSFDEIKKLFKLDKRSTALLRAFTMFAFHPVGPYPVLVVTGQQGSGKSTLCRILQMLIDPHKAGLRSVPNNERDFMIAAQTSWLLVFDNLSHLSSRQSDLLSLAVTGGSSGKRVLYTDAQELCLSAKRPYILNGINDMIYRSDLASRCIFIELKAIPDEERLTESELMEKFEILQPRILGGTLNLVQRAISNYGITPSKGYPRMADFARFAFAAEGFTELDKSVLIHALRHNAASADRRILEGNPIATGIQQLLKQSKLWSGTADELLSTIRGLVPDGSHLPGNARSLSATLRRIQPNLLSIGIEVEFGNRGTGGPRYIHIRRRTS
jgi:putative DNA primase/helicase